MKFGCIGEHLPHSYSRQIHAYLGNGEYELREVAPEALDAFMRKADFEGINVTIPYKQAVIPYLDRVDPRAQAIGAVNTIIRRNGKLEGYNTDFDGMGMLLERMGLCLENRTVLIAGTGGTSRTAAAVAQSRNAAKVLRLSRTGREGALTYAEAYEKYPGAQVLINTTPCGMYPDPDGVPAEIQRFPDLTGVLDAVYNPLRTCLVQEAAERGIPAEGGLYMLVAQAVKASEIFLNDSYPPETCDRVYERMVRARENTVLIGMPGSGKSTIGRLLAEKTGRKWVDTDNLIRERFGAGAGELIRNLGEEAFRRMESEVIRELGKESGLVISTGGGVVLRKENVRALRWNGRLVFLDRPLEELTPSGERPLSDSAEKLRRLYEQRIGIYRACADRIVPVSGSPEETLEKLNEGE